MPTINQIIAIYPGRFQPFGKHHAEAFKWLQKQFGTSKTYIATSDKVDLPKSPFSFKDKSDIISNYGFKGRLVQVKNPYKAEEILSKFDPKTTAVVFMVGAKDMQEDPRFAMKPKKDGSASYFQAYDKNKSNLQGFDTHGYLVVAPHVRINIPGYGEMSGTSLRKALGAKIPRAQKVNLFKAVFGWHEPKTANMVFDKLEKLSESKLSISEVMKFKNIEPSSKQISETPLFTKEWWANSLYLNEESQLDELGLPKGISTVLKPQFEKLKERFGAFIDKIKVENRETKAAFVKLVDAVKTNKKLTTQERNEIGDQMKDVLKLAGFTAASVLPGGVIYLLLSRIPALQKFMVPSAFIKEGLLTEGGAGGHMAHPFNVDWVKSGKDLLKIFDQSVKYLEKGPASVKIDGVNASIRFVELDGKKQFVMDRGSNKPLDVKGITKAELLDRFGEGHGMIKVGGKVLDIFNDAIPKITPALKKLGLWDNPNILFNIEYVAGSTNVLSYSKNFLAVHGLLEIEQVTPKRRGTKEIKFDEKAMQELLNNLAPSAKKQGYEVLGSVPTELKGKPNFGSVLNQKYTINYGGGKEETKTLLQWLSNAKVPDQNIKTVDGKTIAALSKDVLIKISDGTPLSEYIADPKDYQAAIDGFAVYMATMKMGDAVLEKLESPLGPVTDHEGIVIRDKSIYKEPFKITGKFILGGLATSFRK